MIKSEPRVITTLITSDENEPPFRVTDLKQWAYCKRILYYHLCLPKVRPITFKMEEGKEEGKKEEAREKRRSLHLYGLEEGRKEFNVSVSSRKYGLRGKVDLVIWKSDEVIPVDYKFSLKGNREHFQLQLVAYGLLLEEFSGIKSSRGFIYSITSRKVIEVEFNEKLRDLLFTMLEEMHRMLVSERIPEPTKYHRKCRVCEFRRFCNDVL